MLKDRNTAQEVATQNLIFAEINNILEEKSIHNFDIKLNHNLSIDIGFTSLEFAALIAFLEAKTKKDPFAEGLSIASIKSVGDLVAAYCK